MDIIYSIHFANNYWIIGLPAIAALCDVISGFIKAQVTSTKKSSIMRKGLYRKCGELGTILMVWVTCIALELPIKYVAAVSIYVCLMEALSIMENLKEAGVPIPDVITKRAHELEQEINHGAHKTTLPDTKDTESDQEGKK